MSTASVKRWSKSSPARVAMISVRFGNSAGSSSSARGLLEVKAFS